MNLASPLLSSASPRWQLLLPSHSRSPLSSLLGESLSCLPFWFYDLCTCPSMLELSPLFVNFIWMKSCCLSSVTCVFHSCVWEISHVVPCGYDLFILMATEYSALWISYGMVRPTPERKLLNRITIVWLALAPKPCAYQSSQDRNRRNTLTPVVRPLTPTLCPWKVNPLIFTCANHKHLQQYLLT